MYMCSRTNECFYKIIILIIKPRHVQLFNLLLIVKRWSVNKNYYRYYNTIYNIPKRKPNGGFSCESNQNGETNGITLAKQESYNFVLQINNFLFLGKKLKSKDF